jgi:ADP-heptose:LPS heptosyltransferase
MEIASKPWKNKDLPRRILAIRLQAMGDTIITLPYLQALKNSLPAHTRLDFLTREEVASVPESLVLFNKVYCIQGGRNFRKQFIYACILLPRLLFNRYDVVIDLQNNHISNLVRRFLAPRAWSEFDRFSPIAAGERTRMTIESAGLGANFMDSNFSFKNAPPIDKILTAHGWDGKSKLIILNPAGAFITRNWDIDNYIAFAKLWLNRFPDTQFVVTGVAFIADKARQLKNELADSLINLVGSTSPVQAFAIVQKAQMVLSEDSGLMHMAWVCNVPTVAIFGSTRSDWARPLNKHNLLLSSEDLACGNCMLETCIHGDVRCITRYTPQMVFEKAVTFLQLIPTPDYTNS